MIKEKRYWVVLVPGYRRFTMILDELMSQPDALKIARSIWPNANVD